MGKGEIAIRLTSVLRKKGIIVHEFENAGREFRERWVHAFSDAQFEQHQYLTEFLWYMFSAEKMNCLIRKEAAHSFDKVNKRYCYIFFQESDDVLQVEYASAMSANDLLNVTGEYCDVYVVDKGFNWTYVIPHEEDWGPYFYRKKSKGN
ncbi:DUF4275 family protein [Planococcus liqunii]|uniref:DUF4275 family protein n=1 Tax=Planococcus liqunii TaxID=3058394 RepID=UPI003462D3CD